MVIRWIKTREEYKTGWKVVYETLAGEVFLKSPLNIHESQRSQGSDELTILFICTRSSYGLGAATGTVVVRARCQMDYVLPDARSFCWSTTRQFILLDLDHSKYWAR